jgi:hypothetical protein
MIASVLLVIVAWLVTTYTFWVGYVGDDDVFYARYAFLFHRPPINWWEFRMPAILAIRASFLAFGPSELAAALPTLLASLGILASVAWFVRWPATLTWQTQTAMLLAATIPIDVGLRSTPSASFFAAGLLSIGTVCLLKGERWGPFLGGALLALGFSTHELSVFYVAILCCTALLFDRKRFWRPVLFCCAASICVILLEGAVYNVLLGDPFARFRTSVGPTTVAQIGYDADTGLRGVRFFTWPVENLLFCKTFGFDLVILLLSGILTWRYLIKEQRILWAAVFLTFVWLGYGTMVPWAYKPIYRQLKYYAPLAFGVAALLPAIIGRLFANRKIFVYGIIGFVLVVHIICLTAAGGWDQAFEVSKELLRYARNHPDRMFLTDVATMNHMYTINGFQLPGNVVCVNGPGVENNLRLNKEPPGTPRFRFPDLAPNAVLLNLQRLERGETEVEKEFLPYVKAQAEKRMRVVPVSYRILFVPLLSFIEPRSFMVRSLGGEVVEMPAIQ